MLIRYNGEHTCFGCGVSFIDKKHKDRVYCSHSCSKIGKNNPMWKGDSVSYNALHTWVGKNLKNPGVCSLCKKVKKVDAANISGEYKRDLSDWKWLCRRCHMGSDGRLKKLLEGLNS